MVSRRNWKGRVEEEGPRYVAEYNNGRRDSMKTYEDSSIQLNLSFPDCRCTTNKPGGLTVNLCLISDEIIVSA